MPQIFETAIDVIVFIGIAAFLWSVATSLRLIAQSMHARATNQAISNN